MENETYHHGPSIQESVEPEECDMGRPFLDQTGANGGKKEANGG